MNPLTWAVAAVVPDHAGRVLLCQQGRGHRAVGCPAGVRRPRARCTRPLRDIREETG